MLELCTLKELKSSGWNLQTERTLKVHGEELPDPKMAELLFALPYEMSAEDNFAKLDITGKENGMYKVRYLYDTIHRKNIEQIGVEHYRLDEALALIWIRLKQKGKVS